MTFRSLLLASTVLPFALGAPAMARDLAPVPQPAIILAQAEECVGENCPPAEELTPEQRRQQRREERRQQRREERQQQEQQQAPADQGAAPAEEPTTRDERQQQRREERQQQQQQAPADQGAAPAEEPTTREERQQQRREERRQQRREERQQQQQNENTNQNQNETDVDQNQDTTIDDNVTVPQDAPAADEPTTREERRQQRLEERRQQRREERRQQQPEQAPPPAEAPAAQQPPAADEPTTQEQQRQQRREERRQQRREERQQQQQQQQNQNNNQNQNETNVDQNQNTTIQNNVTVQPPPPPEAEQGTREERARRRAERREERRRLREEQAREQGVQEQPAAATDGSVTERQLERQGDRGQAERIRELRRKLREQRQQARETRQGEAQEDRQEGGEERREDRAERRQDRQERIVERRGDRIVVDLGGGRLVVRSELEDETERLLYGARDVQVEYLPNGRIRTIVFRENGVRIVTVRNRNGDIIRRTRILPDNREVILIGFGDIETEVPVVYQPIELPPLQVTIPREEYIVEYSEAAPEQIREVLIAPPVEAVERQYSVEEVTTNERLRDKVRRIDLDTITFEFGSATIGYDQMDALDELGFAMEEVIAENPDEVYLIEGHTDAVGSDADNLLLSDARAEAVAVALSQNFEIPPENLVTEGYGEQYLKVPTEGPERENRRVTVRRITPLISAEAQ